MKSVLLLLAGMVWSLPGPALALADCSEPGVRVQVLGSGGPETGDRRASSGYLIWLDGKARILVDLGPGSLLRFEQAGAELKDLDLVLFTHLHVDHSSDLPALVKAGFFTPRDRDLPLYGPTGNDLLPSMTQFVEGMFGRQGIYRYLSGYLYGGEAYRLLPRDIAATDRPLEVVRDRRYRISAVSVRHGPIPALAWRVEVNGRRVVFSGDFSSTSPGLLDLADGADLLVAHHAIAESAGSVARSLHITPSGIGAFAARAKVKRLVLSHRMRRTLGHETESEGWIRREYAGPLQFADDLQCLTPGS